MTSIIYTKPLGPTQQTCAATGLAYDTRLIILSNTHSTGSDANILANNTIYCTAFDAALQCCQQCDTNYPCISFSSLGNVPTPRRSGPRRIREPGNTSACTGLSRSTSVCLSVNTQLQLGRVTCFITERLLSAPDHQPTVRSDCTLQQSVWQQAFTF